MNFLTYLETKGFSNKTRASIYSDVIKFINWCEDENIESEQSTYTEILAYIKHIQKRNIKQRTIQIYIGSLKHYFTWLVKRELIAENPIKQIKIQGIQRKYLYHIIKKQELETLYESFKIPTTKTHRQLAAKRNKVILGLMIWQGLGTRELANLEEKDLKLREGKIYIQGSRKSNERELKLEAHQVLDIMEYQLKTRQEILNFRKDNNQSDSLFVSTGSSDHFNNIIQKLIQKLKQQNPAVESIKQIRTSVITHWLKSYNLREVQYKAGHRYV
ncbi:MAG: phage integrase N-terminal SAM-like domain-containing protein, partial [Vicingaceae bacterium]